MSLSMVERSTNHLRRVEFAMDARFLWMAIYASNAQFRALEVSAKTDAE